MTLISSLAAFGLLTLAMVGFEIFFTYATQGFAFGFSSNRKQVDFSAFAIRMKRALQNQTEAASYGVPILAAAAFAGLTGGAEIAGALFVAGRAAFVLLYYTGITFIRVPAFVVSTLSVAYIAYALFTTAVV